MCMLLGVGLGRAGTGDGGGGRNLALLEGHGGITAVGLLGLHLVFQQKMNKKSQQNNGTRGYKTRGGWVWACGTQRPPPSFG